jgi:hypothetical protein
VAEEEKVGRQRRPKLRAEASKHQKERRKGERWWRRPGGVGEVEMALGGEEVVEKEEIT